MKKCKIVEAQNVKVAGRNRLLKMELRELYRMLKIPWEDSSDDEDDEEEQPYWLRKKLAEKTASSSKGFDHHHFLDGEGAAKLRRLKKKSKSQKLRAAALLLGRLAASRRTQEHSGIEAPSESNVLPFKDMGSIQVPEGEAIKVKVDEVSKSLQLFKDTLELQLKHVKSKEDLVEAPVPRLDTDRASPTGLGPFSGLFPTRMKGQLSTGDRGDGVRGESEWSSDGRLSSHNLLPGDSSPQSDGGHGRMRRGVGVITRGYQGLKMSFDHDLPPDVFVSWVQYVLSTTIPRPGCGP